MKEENELDISSEAVRDYMDEVPSQLTRWGTTIISVILLITLFLTWVIRYPTIIQCEFTLTTKIAPKPVVARVEGRLEKLLISNNDSVTPFQILGYLESSANHQEVLRLEEELGIISNFLLIKHFEKLDTITPFTYEHLGEVQPAYQNFRQQLIQVNSLLGKGYYTIKSKLLERDILELKSTNEHLQGQYILYARDAALAENEFLVNKKLFNERVISQLDLNREESKLLEKKIPLKNIETSQLNNNAIIRSKEKEIIDLNKQVNEQIDALAQAINSLRSSIASWKNRYLLQSPVAGKVLFSSNLQEKQNVKLNAELFQVFEGSSSYVGLLAIPQGNSGKIKIGQYVLIKFLGYPFEEYGIVEGRVSSSPQLSVQDSKTFFVIVKT